jgi:hypothetical protein
MAVDTPPVHPKIPGWIGERGWSAEGEPPSTLVSFVTEADLEPFKITHNRDILYLEGRLQQDYNFIDYYFGVEGDPLTARYYLGDEDVKITPSPTNDIPGNIDVASALIDPAVLSYFQKRFRQISVMTSEGYEPLWSADGDSTKRFSSDKL